MIDLTAEDRKLVIKGILDSDIKYLNKLLERKKNLLMEIHLLDDSILRKVREIEFMQGSFNLIEDIH